MGVVFGNSQGLASSNVASTENMLSQLLMFEYHLNLQTSIVPSMSSDSKLSSKKSPEMDESMGETSSTVESASAEMAYSCEEEQGVLLTGASTNVSEPGVKVSSQNVLIEAKGNHSVPVDKRGTSASGSVTLESRDESGSFTVLTSENDKPQQSAQMSSASTTSGSCSGDQQPKTKSKPKVEVKQEIVYKKKWQTWE